MILHLNFAVHLLRIRRQHVLHGVILSDPARLRRVRPPLASRNVRQPLERIDDVIKDECGGVHEFGGQICGFVHHFAQHLVREGLIGTADVEDFVGTSRFGEEAIHHVFRQFLLGDRIASRHGSVSEQHVRRAGLDALQLSADGFEEGGGTYDAVRHVGLSGQLRLEAQFLPLQFQQGFADAEGAQKYEVPSGDRGVPTGVEAVERGLIIDRLGLPFGPQRRRQTRNDAIHHPPTPTPTPLLRTLLLDVTEQFPQTLGVLHVGGHHPRALERLGVFASTLLGFQHVLRITDEGHRVVTAGDAFPDHRPTDVARRSGDQHGLFGIGVVVPRVGWGGRFDGIGEVRSRSRRSRR
mmetsp:Transcript_28354/g.57983  ORF Transcript_28354/g.57983 Transcript_28354/m.57983 type:complete len:352 (-) Transcript_28354:364-1419(-)